MSNVPEFEKYPFKVEPLPEDEGGGFVIRFPDLPGCMSDGATYEETIANGRDAFQAWMAAQIEDGRPVPQPHGEGEPAKFVQRLPKYLHTQLIERAAQEGVSMNSLVMAFVAEGLAVRHAPRQAAAPIVGVQDAPRAIGYGEGRNEVVADALYVARNVASSTVRRGSYSEVGSAGNIVMFPQQAKARQASDP